ncbi:MAG: hypothetical protein WCU88_05180 [Elusimicrobiota bacterium]|jgi:hypothetical protein
MKRLAAMSFAVRGPAPDRWSIFACVLLLSYPLIMAYRFVKMGGFYAYSFDDVGRALIAYDWRSSGWALHVNWLPLPMMALSKILLICPNHRVPSLLNLALTVVSFCALYRCARSLFPDKPWIALWSLLLAMMNLQLIVLSISGASEPMLWCLVLWHFKKWLDYLETGLLRDLTMGLIFMGLACWTRPEAWVFLPLLTWWSCSSAAGGGGAFPSSNGRRIAWNVISLWLPLAVFFMAYFLFFGKSYLKVETGALQHGGWAAMLHYPKALWEMLGCAGVAGCAAGILQVRDNVKLRWYAALIVGAFVLFILSAVRAGYAVYYWRTVVLFAMLLFPIIAVGWEGLLAKMRLPSWMHSKIAQGTCIVLTGAFLWLRTDMALRRWDKGLSLAQPMEASILAVLRQPYEKEYSVMLTELYTGVHQEHIHSRLLFRLFSPSRPMLADRELWYDVVGKNDMFQLVQRGNPSLLDLPLPRLRAVLEERKVGAIVMVSEVKAKTLARMLGWPLRSIGIWEVLIRPSAQ